MSNLRADKVGPSAGGTLRDLNLGVAGAWSLFNGVAPAVLASVNLSSLGDAGVGIWDLNFTASFANANYSLGGAGNNYMRAQSSAATVTTARVFAFNQTGSSADDSRMSQNIMGPLA